MNVYEPFKELHMVLNEEDFSLSSSDTIDDLHSFIDDAEDVEEVEIYSNKEEQEKAPEEYLGQIAVKCPVCGTLQAITEDQLTFDDEKELYNVGTICLHCSNDGGFELVGKIAELNPESEETDEVEDNSLDDEDSLDDENSLDDEEVENEDTESTEDELEDEDEKDESLEEALTEARDLTYEVNGEKFTTWEDAQKASEGDESKIKTILSDSDLGTEKHEYKGTGRYQTPEQKAEAEKHSIYKNLEQPKVSRGQYSPTGSIHIGNDVAKVLYKHRDQVLAAKDRREMKTLLNTLFSKYGIYNQGSRYLSQYIMDNEEHFIALQKWVTNLVLRHDARVNKPGKEPVQESFEVEDNRIEIRLPESIIKLMDAGIIDSWEIWDELEDMIGDEDVRNGLLFDQPSDDIMYLECEDENQVNRVGLAVSRFMDWIDEQVDEYSESVSEYYEGLNESEHRRIETVYDPDFGEVYEIDWDAEEEEENKKLSDAKDVEESCCKEKCEESLNEKVSEIWWKKYYKKINPSDEKKIEEIPNGADLVKELKDNKSIRGLFVPADDYADLFADYDTAHGETLGHGFLIDGKLYLDSEKKTEIDKDVVDELVNSGTLDEGLSFNVETSEGEHISANEDENSLNINIQKAQETVEDDNFGLDLDMEQLPDENNETELTIEPVEQDQLMNSEDIPTEEVEDILSDEEIPEESEEDQEEEESEEEEEPKEESFDTSSDKETILEKRVDYDDDIVIVKDESGKVLYKGTDDYNPFRDDEWKYIAKEDIYKCMNNGNTMKCMNESLHWDTQILTEDSDREEFELVWSDDEGKDLDTKKVKNYRPAIKNAKKEPTGKAKNATMVQMYDENGDIRYEASKNKEGKWEVTVDEPYDLDSKPTVINCLYTDLATSEDNNEHSLDYLFKCPGRVKKNCFLAAGDADQDPQIGRRDEEINLVVPEDNKEKIAWAQKVADFYKLPLTKGSRTRDGKLRMTIKFPKKLNDMPYDEYAKESTNEKYSKDELDEKSFERKIGRSFGKCEKCEQVNENLIITSNLNKHVMLEKVMDRGSSLVYRCYSNGECETLHARRVNNTIKFI